MSIRTFTAIIAIPIVSAVAFGTAETAQAATTTTAGGGHRVAVLERRAGVGADKATQVTMSITNDTDETLNLTSATSSGTGNHWQQRPTTLAPGGYEEVSNYAAGDAEISLTYISSVTQTVYTLHSETPLAGKNSSSGTSSSTSYTVNSSTGSGYDPTDIFSMDPGHTFAYTGQSQTFTVPAGVHQLSLDAVGGSGGSGVEDSSEPSGAEVTGTLIVNPGEVLTLGVGGMGGSNYIQKAGDNNWTHTYDGVPSAGWGLQNGATSYAGGGGIQLSKGSAFGGFGGGGASVILDSNGDPLMVAGGGGGTSDGTALSDGFGGQGGYQGQLTGGNGTPNGGQGGANTTSQGQDSPATGGGAGGGGVHAGLAGAATGEGGGAGSSFYSSQIVGGAVRVAPNSNTNAGANSTIVISGLISN